MYYLKMHYAKLHFQLQTIFTVILTISVIYCKLYIKKKKHFLNIFDDINNDFLEYSTDGNWNLWFATTHSSDWHQDLHEARARWTRVAGTQQGQSL
jgi:hypothetical protein